MSQISIRGVLLSFALLLSVFTPTAFASGPGSVNPSKPHATPPASETSTVGIQAFSDFYTQTTEANPGSLNVGAAQGQLCDDCDVSYNLPFSFPFFGNSYSTAYVSENGIIAFDGAFSDLLCDIDCDANDYEPYTTYFEQIRGIYPLWADHYTFYEEACCNDASMDIYTAQLDADHFLIQWRTRTYETDEITDFEVVLGSDGSIKFNYGTSEGGLLTGYDDSPIIGISNGDSVNYDVFLLSGRLDNTNWMESILYTPVNTEPQFSDVAAGSNHSLGVMDDGTLWSWGWNGYGQLGNGAVSNTKTLDPTQVGSNTNWDDVAAGANHSFGIDQDGNLWGWGWNAYGQLGDGTKTNRSQPVLIGSNPVLPNGVNANRDSMLVQVSAGYRHSAAIRSDGSLWVWGFNDFGQLGLGHKYPKLVPTRLGSDSDWVEVSAGFRHTLARKVDGTVWAWGDNFYGQLGDGTTTNRLSPVQVTEFGALSIDSSRLDKIKGLIGSRLGNDKWSKTEISTGYSSIAAGYFHSSAITESGQPVAWGWNQFGQLGDCSNTNSSVPVMSSTFCGELNSLGLKAKLKTEGVGALVIAQWDKTSAGYYHTLFHKQDQSLWSTGYNYNGQLGVGNRNNTNYVVEIETSTFTEEFSAGANHNVGIAEPAFLPESSGSVRSALIPLSSPATLSWGYNLMGQLGDGTTIRRTSPVIIGGSSE